jgi:hypothetical protein
MTTCGKNLIRATKQMHGALRLYQCSRKQGCCRSVRELQEKPRGGSRGASDTHSFRPLVQEEKVSFGEIYSSRCPRVNSVCPAAGGLRLTRFRAKGIDTHEIPIISSEHDTACGYRFGGTRFRKADQQDNQHSIGCKSRQGRSASG